MLLLLFGFELFEGCHWLCLNGLLMLFDELLWFWFVWSGSGVLLIGLSFCWTLFDVVVSFSISRIWLYAPAICVVLVFMVENCFH